MYYSDVIVRRDSPITRLEELEGRSWAYRQHLPNFGSLLLGQVGN